ncbi:hypothetical protein D9M69_644580 [compost metagenome]
MAEQMARLQQLRQQQYEVRDAIQEELKAQFQGKRVRVTHWHGSFTGVVESVKACGFTVYVKNDRTGKVSPRYALGDAHGTAEIEVIEGGANG